MDGPSLSTTGERLQRTRKARKVTQMALASQTGVAHSTVVRIERGQTKPKIETIEKFAEVLGVDAKGLVFGDEPEGAGR